MIGRNRKRTVLSCLSLLLIGLGLLSLAVIPSFSTTTYRISGATVEAQQINGPGYGYDFTNETGQYTINEGIGVGNYTVAASAAGYLQAEANTTVNFISDKKVVDLTINRSAIVWGRVLGYDGHPVVGATVSLYNAVSYEYVDERTTDSNGMYYFDTGIDTGTYYVSVSWTFPFTYIADSITYGGNYTSIPAYSYEDAPYVVPGYISGQSGNVSAIAGMVAQAPDLVLNESGTITGTVKNDKGEPIANAAVSAFNTQTFQYLPSVLTDSNGVYAISYDVTNGTYTVKPYSFGYIADSINVNATQGSTVTQNFTMVKTATIQGHVWRKSDNKPVPDASVLLTSNDSKYEKYASTDTNGYYRINNGLGAANYSVTVNLGILPLNTTTNIILAAGQSMTLDFYVGDVYFISGTVYANNTRGPKLSFAEVDLEFSGFPFAPPGGFAFTDANGAYNMALPIESIFSGKAYNATFTVSCSDYNTTQVNATVTVGNDITNENFVLFKSPPPPPPPPSATIMGTVYGTAGPSLPFSYQWWHLNASGYVFMLGFNSSSYISEVYAYLPLNTIGVPVWGPEGTSGQLTIWIPDAIFKGPFTVSSIPGPNPTVISTNDNGTYTIITVTYGHSSRIIEFQSTSSIPEYSEPAVLATVMFAIAALAVWEKKRKIPQLN